MYATWRTILFIDIQAYHFSTFMAKDCSSCTFFAPKWAKHHCKSRTCKSSFPAKNGWKEGCRPGHTAQPWSSSVIVRAQDFSFLICIDTFSFCFNAISICGKVFSEFNAALVYLFAVYYKYSEISTMTFSTLFLAMNLLRSLEFLVRMYFSIFNLPHNF